MKLSAFILLPVVALSASAFAQSVGDEECDVSKRIQFSLATDDSADGKYIYPVASGHPDTATGEKINAFIKNLLGPKSEDTTRVEAFSEVKYNKYNFLSLSHKAQVYGAGKQAGEPVLKCENLELDTGEPVALDNIMRAGFRDKMPDVYRSVADEDASNRIPKYVRNILADPGPAFQVQDDQSFYVTERDLVLCFDGMQIGESSVDPVELALPFTELTKIIDPNGPLAFAIGSRPSAPLPAPVKRQPVPTSNTRPLPPENSSGNSSGNTGFPAGRIPVSPPPQSTPAPQNRTPLLSYACTNTKVTHRINVLKTPPGMSAVCEVEYLKTTTREILWRSFENVDNCIKNATGLADRYVNQWKWSCTRQEFN